VSWPTLVGGIVVTAMLTPLLPTTGKPAGAQFAIRIGGGFYSPYGQGPYGGYGQPYGGYGQGAYGSYGQPYGRVYGPGYGMPQNRGWGGGYGGGVYGYPGYGNSPYRSGYSYGYRGAPYGRYNGRTTYYQPSNGRVYAPFGYGR
jgi:hypothetical protein